MPKYIKLIKYAPANKVPENIQLQRMENAFSSSSFDTEALSRDLTTSIENMTGLNISSDAVAVRFKTAPSICNSIRKKHYKELFDEYKKINDYYALVMKKEEEDLSQSQEERLKFHKHFANIERKFVSLKMDIFDHKFIEPDKFIQKRVNLWVKQTIDGIKNIEAILLHESSYLELYAKGTKQLPYFCNDTMEAEQNFISSQLTEIKKIINLATKHDSTSNP